MPEPIANNILAEYATRYPDRTFWLEAAASDVDAGVSSPAPTEDRSR